MRQSNYAFVSFYLLNATWVWHIRHRVGPLRGFLKPSLFQRQSPVSALWDLVGAQLVRVAWHSSVETALLLFNDLLRCILICRPQCRRTVFWTARRRHSLFYELHMSCRAQAPFLNQHNMQIEISCKITFRQIQSRTVLSACTFNYVWSLLKYYAYSENLVCIDQAFT